jgi:hypothetical protein
MARYKTSPEKAAAKLSIVGWQDRATVPVPNSAIILGVSGASIRALVRKRELDAVQIAGRVLIKVASLKALVEAAAPHTSSGPRGIARSKAQSAQAAA